MKGYKIISVIKVVLDDILLELYFNVESSKGKKCINLKISEDGETILIIEKEAWVTVGEIQYEAYLTMVIDNDDELIKLVGTEISDVHYGVGKTLDKEKDVIYYFKLNTGNIEFLFFNNGDAGAFSFDRINEVLANDILGYVWTDSP